LEQLWFVLRLPSRNLYGLRYKEVNWDYIPRFHEILVRYYKDDNSFCFYFSF
jgi:hypothetical protein